MVKKAIIYLVLVGISPLIYYVNVARKEDRKLEIRFRFCAELLSIIPFELGILVRRLFYERTLASCGAGLLVFFGAMFLNPNTRVGADVEIRPYCLIGLADIGDHVSFAQRVSLISGRRQHAGHTPAGAQIRVPPKWISIANGVWVGAHAVVMADVGEGSVVGAGAVVVNPVPARSTAVGVPAKIINRDVQ